ncbi:MAG: amidohydrolase family protein [Planctomycetes bacterium]|nr:amidohydrolase family protein [Planctomycetota bacterium]
MPPLLAHPSPPPRDPELATPLPETPAHKRRRVDLVLRRVRVRDDEPLVDVAITDGRIAAIGAELGLHAPEEIDGDGHVLVPGLVESHLHLDKALLADYTPNASGTLSEAISATARHKATVTAADLRARAETALTMALRHGTTAIRAETEFDPFIGLTGIAELLALKRRYAHLVTLQVVAFPQEGVFQHPGTEQLFREAMRRGADVVGGVPYNDIAPHRHIDLCFEIAREFDRPISLHQDFSDGAEGMTMEYVARKTIAAGWQGRVAVGHATALGALPPSRLKPLLALLREADITVVTLPLTDLYLGGRRDTHKVRRALAPVAALLKAGVNVAVSSNNLRNAFTPFGTGDLLSVAALLIAAAHLGGGDLLPRVLDLATTNAARALGLGPEYGLAVGRRADLVVLDTRRVHDAVIDLPERLWVLKDGRVTVRNTRKTEFRATPAAA